jgi:hypothetical protein
MARLVQSISTSLGNMWCQAMHSDAMWPVKGEYQCRTCLRKFRVSWEASPEQTEEVPAKSIQTAHVRVIP